MRYLIVFLLLLVAGCGHKQLVISLTPDGCNIQPRWSNEQIFNIKSEINPETKKVICTIEYTPGK